MTQSIRKWQSEFRKGAYENPDFETQVKAGWFDWFCEDEELAEKTKILGAVINRLKDSKRVNLDTMYTFFKNNCPCGGPLYDDFRICDIETHDVLYCIAHDDAHDDEEKMWNVHAVCEGYGSDGHNWTCYKFDTTEELVNWLNEKE